VDTPFWLFVSGHEFSNVTSGRAGVVSETDFSILAEMPAEIM